MARTSDLHSLIKRAASFSLPRSRPTITTRLPCSPRSFASAKPIPRVPPVMIATLSLRAFTLPQVSEEISLAARKLLRDVAPQCDCVHRIVLCQRSQHVHLPAEVVASGAAAPNGFHGRLDCC